MSEPIRPTAHTGRECPRCAETVADGVSQCGFCSHPMRAPKTVSTRMLEVGSLAMVLGLVVGVCRVLGEVIGV